ncbi:hypothetical protein QI3_2997 [Clostridioides difficile 842]|nr:hypothetical protein QEA_2444 [Clostridioides difficile CD109]EQF94369.1 hypothetical protein QI3_2997 [Clostridioides difficile 842]EQG02070.1 hypothetical protein QGY_0865 [Clostridioides difficile 840]EQG49257.1 hypothetical protein QIS_0947 [Clostridioides difficile DA00131]EQH72338.1 hypothetical protein QMQ_0904 [Clostridioides difficile DA00306]EQI13956.1 hypothetical protein QOI_0915 [Clostridioides difficile Y21]EQI93883.1 hypothetical protein QQO_1120 [Clostridioides difficile P3
MWNDFSNTNSFGFTFHIVNLKHATYSYGEEAIFNLHSI